MGENCDAKKTEEILDEFIKVLPFHSNHADASIRHHSYKAVFFDFARKPQLTDTLSYLPTSGLLVKR